MRGSTPPWPASGSSAAVGLAAEPGLERRRVLAVMLLGLNLWGVALLWPLVGAGGGGDGQVALALACLLPLALGAVALLALAQRPRRARVLAAGLWLVVYPTAVAATLAARPEAQNQLYLGPIALALAWLSLCAYGAAAAAACAERPAEAPAQHTALGREPWDAPAQGRGRLQRFVIALCALAAVAIGVLAPALGGYAQLTQSWGDAALEGGVLTAVVGAALGVAVLAVFLGGALRADNAPAAPRGEPGLRIAWFLFLALLGAVTFFVVQP